MQGGKILGGVAVAVGVGLLASHGAVVTSEPVNRAGPAQRADRRAGTFPLVTLQTGQDPSCRGGNRHTWPVGMGSEECHGWRAVDPSGRQHDNSANHIQCHPDGSFSFTQHAGNLTCEGNGVTKTHALNTCEQDVPPALHTKAIDLTCCSRPDAPECTWGLPSVTVPGSTIFLNGRPIAE